jgi:hypothetical protein
MFNKCRSNKRYDDGGIVVFTAYTTSGLALFCIFAYFLSNFIAR